MKKVTSYYFKTDSGREPAKEFIDSLAPKTQRKFFFVRGLLEEFGHRLPYPHAENVGDEIYELRFSGIEGTVRVLYFFFHQDKVVFTNGFLKKTNKLRPGEKTLAMARRKAYLSFQK